jgi:hypothetical protein
MPVAARRRRRAEEERIEAERNAAVAADEAARAADSVRALARDALGTSPPLAAEPEPVLGWGSHAYRVRLTAEDPAWGAPLVARTAGVERAANERRWLGELGAAGFPAPAEVGHDPETGLVVFREPDGTPLAERMFAEMMSLPRLLAGFGRLHARLHGLEPPADAGPPAVAGIDALAEEADDPAVADAIGAEVALLARRRPEAGPQTICHGELNPVQVYSRGGGDGDGSLGDADDGTVSVPVNWAVAGVGDAELDVAATLVGFWSGGLYIANAVQRRMYRMARDPLASGYLNGYEAAAARPLDHDRLRWWQAVQLCSLAAGIARCTVHGSDGPWDAAGSVVQPRAALDEIRSRVRELAAG